MEGWVELATDDGTPFYYNARTCETAWTRPDGDKGKSGSGSGRRDEDWAEMRTEEGAVYYWNVKTDEVKWTKPLELMETGKKYGRWRECEGPDGRYFYDEVTMETRWELDADTLKQSQSSDASSTLPSKSLHNYDSSSSSSSSLPPFPSTAAAASGGIRRASSLQREAEFLALRLEREALAEERRKLEEARGGGRSGRAGGEEKTGGGVLGGVGATTARRFAGRRTSATAPTIGKEEREIAFASKDREKGRPRIEKSRKHARGPAGPTLAKAYFPEKSSCPCCSGYIYGCSDPVCHDLGKCICSLEEGESTGTVKKKKGDYEMLTLLTRAEKTEKARNKHKQHLKDIVLEKLHFLSTLPYLWYYHGKRVLIGSFQDPQLASSSERQYLAERFDIDKEVSAMALGLLAWRKSAILVLLVVGTFVVMCDIYNIQYLVSRWRYMEEAIGAPVKHAVSGFPPRALDEDYISQEAQDFFNVTSPADWTTRQGLWRFESEAVGARSDLCLNVNLNVSPKTKSISGNPIELGPCNKYSQWLHGNGAGGSSDATTNEIDSQHQMQVRSAVPGWWTVDDLVSGFSTTACTVAGGCEPTTLKFVDTVGFCMEASNAETTNEIVAEILPCSGYQPQGWDKLTAKRVVESKFISDFNREYPLHYLRSLAYPDKCLAVPSSVVEYDAAKKKMVLKGAIGGAQVFLKNCDGTTPDWTILSFRGSPEKRDRSSRDREVKRVYHAVLDSNLGSDSFLPNDGTPCMFLSQPESRGYWPVAEHQDAHVECIKMYPKNVDTRSVSTSYDLTKWRYDRFTAYVGLTAGLQLKNNVTFTVIVDDVIATQVNCGARTVSYSWNDTVLVSRNFCSYDGCQRSNPYMKSSERCNKPFTEVDVLLPSDAKKLTLQVSADSDSVCSSVSISNMTVLCDGIQYAAFASPRLTSTIELGEEDLVQYTYRMGTQMKSKIMEASLLPEFIMSWALLCIDVFVLHFLGRALKWWTTYKFSRKFLGMSWLVCFVGPLAISCVPTRLFMDWSVADSKGEAYMDDTIERYSLEQRENDVVHMCKLLKDGSVENELEKQVSLIVDFCGLTRDISLDEAILWANYSGYQIEERDVEWYNRYGLVNKGFPSTCHSADGDIMQKTCTGNGAFDGLLFSDGGPPPCSCPGSCEMVGWCRFFLATGEESYVSCAQLIPGLNCTDMAILSDVCNCGCAAPTNATDVAGQHLNTCRNGYVENFVPKLKHGPFHVPYSDTEIGLSTYKIHYACGIARGNLYQGKFAIALERAKEACDELLLLNNDGGVFNSDKFNDSIHKGVRVGKKISAMGASYGRAMDNFVLAIPAALSIGPGLLIGALRAKTMVPQAASPGMFVVLLPWLYAPILWCLFNFFFQYAGNIYLLPGLIILALAPMSFFVIGIYYDLTRPLAKKRIKVAIITANRVNYVALFWGSAFVIYGFYYAIYYEAHNDLIKAVLYSMWDGQKQNHRWEWVNLFYLTPPIINTIFKYTLTTVLGIDFFVYELIHQRMYEIFLEDGIAGVMEYSKDKPRHFDYTPEQIVEISRARVERLNAFSKLVAAPTNLVSVDLALTKKHRQVSAISSFLVSARALTKKVSSFSVHDPPPPPLSDKEKHSAVERKSSKKLRTAASEKKASKEKFRIWNSINSGQPLVENFMENMWNYMITTPLHLQRVRNKFIEAKRMASTHEIEYLSATHALTFNKDSSLCFEVVTWRRSCMWILLLMTFVNVFFGWQAMMEEYNNNTLDSELENYGPLHRFPQPNYVSSAALKSWSLPDPSTWTLYTGPIHFNHTASSNLSPLPPQQWFMSACPPPGTSSQGGSKNLAVGLTGLGSNEEFSYARDCDRWSLNVNGTFRNNEGLCVTPFEDKLGSNLTIQNCAADFVGYDAKSEILKRQTWKSVPIVNHFATDGSSMMHIMSKSGLCIGVRNLCKDFDSLCPRWAENGKCSTNKDFMRETCSVSCGYCQPPGDRTTPYAETDTVSLELVDCKQIHTSSEALEFSMPNPVSYKKRIDWYCDNVVKQECAIEPDSHVNLDMTLKARFDYGNEDETTIEDEGISGLVGADILKRWRCYSTDALVEPEEGSHEYGGYDVTKQSRSYCTRQKEITNELKMCQGIEPFSDFSVRMTYQGYIGLKDLSTKVQFGLNIFLLVFSILSGLTTVAAVQLYSRYKASRRLMLLGWLFTFIGPFLTTVVPLRLFLSFDKVDVIARVWADEFDAEYGTKEKEALLIKACSFAVDVDQDEMIATLLDICGDNEVVDLDTAIQWGDESAGDFPYSCTSKYPDDEGQKQSGYGYPMMKRDPCRGLNKKLSPVGGLSEDMLDYCYQSELIPSFLYNGLIPRLLTSPVTGRPLKIDIEMFYPVNQALRDVHIDMKEPVIQCGRARKMLCDESYDKAVSYVREACTQVLSFLDNDSTTESQYLQYSAENIIVKAKEGLEAIVCSMHALKSFKTMSSATFALAPALIRSAIKVKTAVPQSPLAGMFIIALPWLYSPMVWCIFNIGFQLIGNWQLLIGLMAYAFGPLDFFILGLSFNVTRPFDDKEAVHMLKVFDKFSYARIAVYCGFTMWGLYDFGFRENDEYFAGYKQELYNAFSLVQMLSLASSILAKYLITTIVGVDYMLDQVLSARKHEVLMSMANKSEAWAASSHATLAAEIHKDYVKLLNIFCKIQDKAQTDRNEWLDNSKESGSFSSRSASPTNGAGEGSKPVESNGGRGGRGQGKKGKDIAPDETSLGPGSGDRERSSSDDDDDDDDDDDVQPPSFASFPQPDADDNVEMKHFGQSNPMHRGGQLTKHDSSGRRTSQI